MGFFKHKAGLIVLIISMIIIVAAIWYLMFGMSDQTRFEGGVLAEGIRNMRMMVRL